ncbi:MAG: glycosyltransferase family 2 protein [Mucilaginibacter sp.]|nr:glycosyltransferase family 2 protein [Mucilaginibacter sp.]
MVPVSIVIITKNRADIIKGCIDKARMITDDIVVIESDRAETTSDITSVQGCRVCKQTWDGYGANKNKGIKAAKYNWILSLDADEIPNDELILSLHKLNFDNATVVYDIKFKSYFGEKPIRFGSWGKDHHIRLFNRSVVKWSETIVHETLLLPDDILIKKLAGYIHHYSVKDIYEYKYKGFYYAKLSAKKYFNNGKKANAVKLYISPVFGFIKNYIFFLGLLDGREGWVIASINFKNTWRKYYFLSRMQSPQEKKQSIKDSFVIEY